MAAPLLHPFQQIFCPEQIRVRVTFGIFKRRTNPHFSCQYEQLLQAGAFAVANQGLFYPSDPSQKM